MWKLLLASVGSLGFCAAASGAELRVIPVVPNGSVAIVLEGTFEPADMARFRSLTADLEKAVVVFNSNGGNLGAGLDIGKQIRARHYATYVKSGTCTSACALAWLAGTPRMMATTARIGFHAAYALDVNGTRTESGSANALVGAYLNRLGLSDQAVEHLTTARPNQITWLDASLAKSLGVDVVVSDTGFAPAPAYEYFNKGNSVRDGGLNTPPGTSQFVQLAPQNLGPPTTRVGPSFECNAASTQLQGFICGDEQLSRADLRLAQPYMALSHTVGSAGRGALKAEASDFLNKMRADCGIIQDGAVRSNVDAVRQCMLAHYAEQYVAWLNRLSGPALEEAARPAIDNRLCQYRLKAAGFLPSTVPANGVLDEDSRNGIVRWQASVNHSQTGFLSDADTRILLQ